MKRKILNALALGLISVFTLSSISAGQDLAGVKCVMNGEAQASADASTDYKDGKVFFCCDKCLAAFNAENAKPVNGFSTKANHQLLLTGQYAQVACPISGKPVAADKSVDVGGAKIGMCCGGCVAKVAAAEGLKAKAALVFANAAFDQGFALKEPELSLEGVKCLIEPERDVSEEFSAEHNGHKVFFCCVGCQGKFTADPAAHVAIANHQLAKTGQVQQVACPFSGGPVKDDQSTEVGGVTVKYCCGNCKAKMKQADAALQIEFAFGERGFTKGFMPE